ncbi:MAG TPA: 4Fe-4S dicluster domain-containing protein [Geopsychrobacteraceae bacterium]|nr:4Fe-4S dicluster domain-containing protein [Geopsychrobacteraceae bacterium]
MTESKYRLSLLSPWRRTFQWITTLLLLLIPWVSIQNRGLLRIDLSSLSLHVFGEVLRIEELYLFLIFCLAFGIAFLLITMVFGRVWCGWACPQTTITDLAEWFSKQVGLKTNNYRLQGGLAQKTLTHLFFLILSLLVGANLVWYFIAPQRFFAELSKGSLHIGAWVSWLTIALTIYLDLALIRRLMCRDFCPYGRFQTVLADQGTLALHLPAEESYRCIECDSCVNACPMGIDIREGYQVACINCGRCLDACRKIMAPGKQPGLIHYSFGTEGHGVKTLLNPRTLLLTTAMVIMIIIFSFAVNNRQLASLKVSVSHMASARVLKDGKFATFFNSWVNNRSSEAEVYRLQARSKEDQTPLTLKGQTSKIVVAPGGNQKLDFVLITKIPERPYAVEFLLSRQTGEEVSIAEAQVTPVGSH